MENQKEKLILIDGHSMLFRAFYGMPDLTNAGGVHTGAVYGFLNILFKILEEEQAQYLVVAFDVHAPTFRHEMYAEYKGTRKPMPPELREQVPLIKKVLKAMGIVVCEREGLEADDILGTMANIAQRRGMEVSVVSGDRDLLQVATDIIRIRIPKTKGGQTQIENYYAEDVKESLGVTPLEFIQVKALMGDTADNIPGVPKVGQKTATTLIQQYHSVDGVYEHLDEIKKPALHRNLEENEDLARLSLRLAKIKLDCDIEWDSEMSRIGNLYTKEAFEIFTELGFKNFLNRFAAKEPEKTEITAEKITERGRFDEAEEELCARIEQAEKDAFAVALFPIYENSGFGTEGNIHFYALAAAVREKVYYFVSDAADLSSKITQDDLIGTVARLRKAARIKAADHGEEPEDAKIACFGIKEQYPLWGIDAKEEFESSIDLSGILDLLIGCYLCNPLKNDYAPEDAASEYIGETLLSEKVLLGKKSLRDKIKEEPEKVSEYACACAAALYKCAPLVRERLIEREMWKLYTEMERPLSYILYDMERIGIRIRPEALREYSESLGSRIDELEAKIHEETGEDFNIASPKQLGEVLFGKMGLPGGKKTKTGYSTAAGVLEKLAPEYPIVNDILEYRGLTKLKSTYADGLTAFIAQDGRIHTTFKQTITATGRISSTDPNLQNIPMKTELGKQIRKAFVPSEECSFIDSDYSQIELRILAHMSGDEELIEAYKENRDIHTITASKVFHTPFEEVTALQRRNAKAVNFGIVYGISSFGLSQGLSISRKEAAEYIDAYFKTYPGIKTFLDKLVADAGANGYAVTMFGRRRPVPELTAGNFMQRQFGERVAMNSPIQGSAADIMKLAMIDVWEELHRRKMKSELILQIHDELLIETAPGEEEAVKEILADKMSGAAKLSVFMETDIHCGTDWYMAK